jgi:hypothetical protein
MHLWYCATAIIALGSIKVIGRAQRRSFCHTSGVVVKVCELALLPALHVQCLHSKSVQRLLCLFGCSC